MENSMEVLPKIKKELLCDPAFQLQDIYPKVMKSLA
jgi:hypothetical protein